jgi:hypothetical protein
MVKNTGNNLKDLKAIDFEGLDQLIYRSVEIKNKKL